MGTLSEYFRYMETDPKFVADAVKTFSHLRITSKLKKQRKQLKLYKDGREKEEDEITM